MRSASSLNHFWWHCLKYSSTISLRILIIMWRHNRLRVLLNILIYIKLIHWSLKKYVRPKRSNTLETPFSEESHAQIICHKHVLIKNKIKTGRINWGDCYYLKRNACVEYDLMLYGVNITYYGTIVPWTLQIPVLLESLSPQGCLQTTHKSSTI